MILIINSCTQEDLIGAVISSPSLGALAVDSFMAHCCIAEEFRCAECDKLLSKSGNNGIIAGEIKCSRCKALNII